MSLLVKQLLLTFDRCLLQYSNNGLEIYLIVKGKLSCKIIIHTVDLRCFCMRDNLSLDPRLL